MAYVFRGIPPRILQRILDNRSGRIPGRNRTGDRTRARWAVDAYDDRRTVVFDTNQIVSFPQKLQSGSIHDNYLPILDPTGQFSAVTASVVAGVSDSLIFQQANVSTMGPWIEDQAPEQGRTSDFWLTGVALTTGEGFTGQLRDKTQIKIKLPITTPYDMLSQTASMIYYNVETQGFDLAGAGTGNETTNPGDFKSVPGVRAFYNLHGGDGRLFGPYGNNITSGSFLWDTIGVFNQNDSTIDGPYFTDALAYRSTGSTLLDKSFAANSQQIIRMDQIHAPFLLEKVHIRLPFKAGEDWFDDVTRTMVGARSRGTRGRTGDGYGVDCGGPCVTVALQRQDSSLRRELILSATIIPQGDNISSYDYAVAYYESSFDEPNPAVQLAFTQSAGDPLLDIPSDPQPGQPHTWPKGFLSFATPSFVVQPNNGQEFTGTLELLPDVAVSNGLISLGWSTLWRVVYGWSDTYQDTLVLAANPFGRGMDLRPSGRSYFGKEYVTPEYKDVTKKPRYYPAVDTSFDVYNEEQTAISPYVLLPGDELIFSVSKYRSILNQFATSSYGTMTDADVQLGVLSGSHNVGINSGTIEITLYGSLIRGQTQFHDTLNQQLTSLTMHEALGGEVYDQFDVEAPIVFSGSYIDDIITGTLGYDENGVLRNDRGVAASLVGSQYLIAYNDPAAANLPPNVTSSGSLLRGVLMHDESEVYYDSLVPSIYDIQRVEAGNAWTFSKTDPTDPLAETSEGKINYIHLGKNVPDLYNVFEATVAGSQIFPINTIKGNEWQQSFPFESKYGNIVRQSDIKKIKGNYNATLRFSTGGMRGYSKYTQTPPKHTLSKMTQFYTTTPSSTPGDTDIKWNTLSVLANGTGLSRLWPSGVLDRNFDVVTRATYGIGKEVQAISGSSGQTFIRVNSPRWTKPSTWNDANSTTYTPPPPSPSAPPPVTPIVPYIGDSGEAVAAGTFDQFSAVFHVYQDVEMNGWKYGLKSAYATPSRMVFSRNHHGYLRDTLEQRPFTKYVVNGKTEGGPVFVKFTLPDPKDTDSSNLHFEATSSLPYFDGDIRNRTTSTTKFNLVQVPIPGLNNSGQLTINDLIP